jgi:signal transduction histidine kinase
MLLDLSKHVIDLLFDKIPMGLAIFDDQIRLVRFNPTWEGFIRKYTYTKLVVYRVAQEALNNIAKHATPSNVKILFHVESNLVNLMIEDDGGGFDPKKIDANHFGIGFMQERAEGIGAEIKIHSQPNEGTLVQLIIR